MTKDKQDIVYKVRIGTWKKIINIVFKSKRHLALLIFCSAFIAVLDGLIPLLNRYAVDTFFVAGDYGTWPWFVLINVVIAIFFGLSVWGFIY